MKKRKLTKILLSLATGIAVAMPLIGEKVEVSAAEEVETVTQLINPVAKYEFKDASNPGRDSMGNYDLVTKTADGQTNGTVSVSDDVISFNGSAGLAATIDHDIGDNLDAFTLCFDVMQPQSSQNWWVYPIGFGWGGHDKSEFFGFNIQGDSPILRFNDWNVSQADFSVPPTEPYWQHVVGTISQDQFTNVCLSVQPGEKLNIYFDGNLTVSYNIAANFSNTNSVKTFGIGGLSMWGNIYEPWIGSMKNVQIYDVAMSSSEVVSYIETGNLYREVVINDPNDLAPVALYEFNDSGNPGKDSKGNYHLNKSGDGSISIENGIATFNGTAGLISNPDISEDLESFSLVFDIKTTTNHTDWAEPIGFGWDGWGTTDSPLSNWNLFQLSPGSDLLRYGAKGMSTSANQFWLDEVGTLGTTNYNNVALTINKSGNTVVYLNGKAINTYNTPADFTLDGNNMYFAIGGNGSWGSVGRCMWQGSMDTVAIYDFAMTAEQVSAYNTNGKLQISDLTTETYISEISSASFSGNETTTTLYDNMSTDAMFAALNPANAVATMSDGTTKQLPLTWTSVVNEDGKYYAVGTTRVVGQSIPTRVSKATVKHELTVVDYASTCMDGVVTYMNLAYRYTNNEGTYSNVEFRLQVGYDSLITTKATEYGASEYGIEVSTTAKTQKYAYTQATRLDSTQNINYEIISLGDAINNIDRSTVVFTVKAYMVVDGVTYYSNVVKTYSVVDMVAAYYADDSTKDAVSGLYELYTAKGYYNA